MLQKFEIQGVHYVVDDNLRKYVSKKIGGLDKYLSKHSRLSAHGEVFLKESQSKDKVNCICEVTLYLPHQTLNVTETAQNMFAAVDIAEAKLKLQHKKYKDLHQSSKIHQRIIARLRR
jgi:ribosomal subunit interface protein